MNNFTPETTVGAIVRATPASSRIFEHLGIDYCCGGKKPLAEACRVKGLDPATVVAMLTAFVDAAGAASATHAEAMSLAELCDHIEHVHHEYLRRELPRLDYMTRRVAAVHGADEPRLLAIRQVFSDFAPEMVAHMRDEEERVFPAIRQLDRASAHAAAAVLKSELAKLETEHGQAGAALAQFRELTSNYTPPEWACNTYRALFDALAELERNMHQHVHQENNVLFPKALEALVTAA